MWSSCLSGVYVGFVETIPEERRCCGKTERFSSFPRSDRSILVTLSIDIIVSGPVNPFPLETTIMSLSAVGCNFYSWGIAARFPVGLL